MSKNATTNQPKPAVEEAALQAFIGGDNKNKAAAPALAVVKPASQPAEATAMLSVRIPASLHRDLPVHSVTVRMPIQDIVTELLSTYLSSQPVAARVSFIGMATKKGSALIRRKEPEENEQAHLFFCDVVDVSIKDSSHAMALPFLSLSKRPRFEPIHYVNNSTGEEITVSGSKPFGIATIWDFDIFFGCLRSSV